MASADLLTYNRNIITDNDVITLKNNAYTEALKIKNSNKLKKLTLIYTLQSLIRSLVAFDKLSEAKAYLNINNEILKTYPDERFINQALIIKGTIENSEKKYIKAIGYFSKVIENAKENNNNYMLYQIYPLLFESYDKLNNSPQKKLYSESYKKLLDSVNRVKKETSDISYINIINQKVLYKKQRKTTLQYMAIIWRYFSAKKRDLCSKKTTFKLYETTLNDSKQKVTKELISLAGENVNLFYLEFQKNYPEFYKTLQKNYPQLTLSDINFCALIKMNFEIKEISKFTHCSMRAAEVRKYRIKKKMNLKNKNELYIMLSGLNN